MEVTCVDLKAKFGKQYRVIRDPAQYGADAKTTDPWCWVIPCRTAHLFPWGGDYLGVATKGRGSVAKTLRGMDGVELRQDGSDGCNFRFHVDLFDKVAAVVHPCRRRRMSEEQRAASVERLRQYQFPAARDGMAAVDEPAAAQAG